MDAKTAHLSLLCRVAFCLAHNLQNITKSSCLQFFSFLLKIVELSLFLRLVQCVIAIENLKVRSRGIVYLLRTYSVTTSH